MESTQQFVFPIPTKLKGPLWSWKIEALATLCREVFDAQASVITPV